MSKRTGTIEWRNGWAFARVWMDGPEGPIRKRVALRTRDKNAAARMLAKVNRMIERGELTLESAEDVGAEAFKPFAEQWSKKRVDDGVAMAKDERINLTKHVYDVTIEGSTFGDLAILDVRPRHVVAVLQAAIDKGLRKGTVEHIKRMLSRIFSAAIGADLLLPGTSPVKDAKTPRIPEAQRVKKKRVTLTDAEVAQFFECEKVDLELRMMSLCARTSGGMRTSDVNRWDWSHIDTKRFEMCKIPRQKTDSGPQELEIPEMLRPFLAAWWIQANKPTSGPVFPVTKGARKGEFRAKRGVSYAGRLRKALRLAGLTRPELYVETATTLPVDFHSFRRAFVTALAEADINQQRAMTLSHHSDAKTHMGYVAETSAMKRIPVAALPAINAGSPAVEYPAGDTTAATDLATTKDQSGKRDSNPRPSAWEAVSGANGSHSDASALQSSEKADGSEPPRFTGSEGERTPVASAGTRSVACLSGVSVVVIGPAPAAPIESRCVAGVSPDESASFDELMLDASELGGKS